MVLTPDVKDGGYVASFPDLPGCITCADTKEKAIANAKDAKRAWIEAALESNRLLLDCNETEQEIIIRTARELKATLVSLGI